MEKSAIYHQSDSRFSYPIDSKRALITLQVKKDDDIKSVTVIWNTGHYYYKEQKRTKMTIATSDALYDYYRCYIGNDKPGYSYIFEIVDGNNQKWYYNESGLDTTLRIEESFKDNFTVVFPNENDIVKPNKVFEGRVFYQIFPERFAKSSHKENTDYINLDWNSEEPVNDKFMGGDLNGIIEKLSYLKRLGIGAIYLTPIHPSISAHKYDIDDYFDIDKMFGSKEDLKNLVKEAHAKDIKIVMDLVFNHSSFYNEIFQDVVKNGRKSKYYNWYFIDGDKPTWEKGNYLTFCDVKMMPKLNTNNPEVQKYLTSVGEFYIRDFDIDGFRLDVAFDVSHDFWRYFKHHLKLLKKDIFIIGEDWQNSESFLGNDQWDSVMNYPFLYACQRYYAYNRYDNQQFVNYLNNRLVRYKDGHNSMMLNLLDSHDIERFYNTVNFNKDLVLLAIATMMFYQGCPMIYYGDEIFMEGKNDPYNRKGMRWNSPNYKIMEHQVFKALLKFRKEKALKFGDIKIYTKNDLVYISRTYEDEELVLVINHSDKMINNYSKKIIYGYRYHGKTMLPNSFVILKY